MSVQLLGQRYSSYDPASSTTGNRPDDDAQQFQQIIRDRRGKQPAIIRLRRQLVAVRHRRPDCSQAALKGNCFVIVVANGFSRSSL